MVFEKYGAWVASRALGGVFSIVNIDVFEKTKKKLRTGATLGEGWMHDGRIFARVISER